MASQSSEFGLKDFTALHSQVYRTTHCLHRVCTLFASRLLTLHMQITSGTSSFQQTTQLAVLSISQLSLVMLHSDSKRCDPL